MSMVVGVTALAINPIILVVSRLGDERDRSIALLWLPCRLQPPTIPSLYKDVMAGIVAITRMGRFSESFGAAFESPRYPRGYLFALLHKSLHTMMFLGRQVLAHVRNIGGVMG